MSSAVDQISVEILDNVVAPALVSVVFTALWVGIILVFAYQYYRNFPRDSAGIKSTVVCSLILQVLNTIVMTKMVYFYLVVSSGKSDNLDKAGWEFITSVVLLVIIDFIVQSFYAYRLSLLIGRGYVLRAIVLCLPVPGLAFGLAVARFLSSAGTFLAFYKYTWIVIAWFAGLTACDVILTGGQVFYLHYHRTGLARTNRLVNIIIIYITSTAIVATIFIIIQLATFVVIGWNFTQSFLTFQTSGMRVLFLLANLNSRQILLGIEGHSDCEAPTIEKSLKALVPSTFNSDNSSFGKHHNITDTVGTRTTVVLSDSASVVNITSPVEFDSEKPHF